MNSTRPQGRVRGYSNLCACTALDSPSADATNSTNYSKDFITLTNVSWDSVEVIKFSLPRREARQTNHCIQKTPRTFAVEPCHWVEKDKSIPSEGPGSASKCLSFAKILVYFAFNLKKNSDLGLIRITTVNFSIRNHF